MKRKYTKPALATVKIQLGVFGEYGRVKPEPWDDNPLGYFKQGR